MNKLRQIKECETSANNINSCGYLNNGIIYYAKKVFENESAEKCDLWEIKEPTGEESTMSTIYSANCNEDYRYVMKTIDIDKTITIKKKNETELNEQKKAKIHVISFIITRGQVVNEIKCQQQASMSGIAPRIIKIFEFDDNISFIMDRIDGRTAGRQLEELSKMKGIGKQQKQINLFQSINKALVHLHDTSNVIHGDPHLNNFIINNKNEVKIIDFGNSKLLKDCGDNVEEKMKCMDEDIIKLYNSIVNMNDDVYKVDLKKVLYVCFPFKDNKPTMNEEEEDLLNKINVNNSKSMESQFVTYKGIKIYNSRIKLLSQPTDSVYNPQPTESVYNPQPTESVYNPQPTESVYNPQPTETGYVTKSRTRKSSKSRTRKSSKSRTRKSSKSRTRK